MDTLQLSVNITYKVTLMKSRDRDDTRWDGQAPEVTSTYELAARGVLLFNL